MTTIAGNPGVPGYANGYGSSALFNGPCALAADAAGNLYVADSSNQVIRLIDPAGNVSNYAGAPNSAGYGDGSPAFFNYPAGLALDSAGNLFVADSRNQLIRKIAPGGNVTHRRRNLLRRRQRRWQRRRRAIQQSARPCA